MLVVNWRGAEGNSVSLGLGLLLFSASLVEPEREDILVKTFFNPFLPFFLGAMIRNIARDSRVSWRLSSSASQ